MLSTRNSILIRDLGNGLILRRSSSEDAEKLAEFNSMIHGDNGPDPRVGQWTRDLLERPHPTFGVNDFTVVEEKTSGKIVSSLNLIPQTWAYEGISFGVGRPELVGTLPEYRRKGLVRIQFEEIHRWSKERGELAQAITGIPNYYRQFDYEMCLDLEGNRAGGEGNLPKLAEHTQEPFQIRPATESDIKFLESVSAYAAKRSLIHVPRDEALWKLELNGRSENNVNRYVWNIIERSTTSEAVGFVVHPWYAWKNSVPAVMYELKAGMSWLEVTPSVARWLWNLGGEICAREGKLRQTFKFSLGGNHPVYEIMRENLPEIHQPYAWYMRVPDMQAFIRRIAPALEARLADSLIPGYNGEIKFNFYTHGLMLGFENGRLLTAEHWQPDSHHEGDISFPYQTFLQVLFGHRSLDEIKKAYADCFWGKDEARLLVNTLFPRKPSSFIGIA